MSMDECCSFGSGFLFGEENNSRGVGSGLVVGEVGLSVRWLWEML